MTYEVVSVTPDTPEWRDIPGWVGLYQASSTGHIRSLDMTTNAGRRKGRVLKPWVTVWGYEQVHLSRDGVRRARPVHQLVLEAFVGPRPEGHEACHSDAVRANNSIQNLRWDTVSENRLDITRAGNNAQSNKTICNRGHALAGANLRVTASGRRCIACARAASYARNVLGEALTQDLADEYYRKVSA